MVNRKALWLQRLRDARPVLDKPIPMTVEGRLNRMVGLTLEAVGCRSAIGGRCRLLTNEGLRFEAEVVGFSGDKTYLMPTSRIQGLTPDARVIPLGQAGEVEVGDAMLGRILDGAGQYIDGVEKPRFNASMPLQGRPINPLLRQPIREPLDVGVRAINSLLTVGSGQRLGLFAGSGVGKSVLLGMMTKFTNADVTVVGLIGERGREVREFIVGNLGAEGLARSVVVAAPADAPPLLRLQGAMMATSIAEYFRDQGKRVLLLMDSLTRFAQAQREIALAVGEPPATKGYPPSVFAKLPELVERAGNGRDGQGSITAFYTVLTEGDDQQDPIADAARAILDGHIVLSRQIAESGVYPAIDIEASISRVMNEIVDNDHRSKAQRFKQLYSLYERSRDLISVGAYSKGSDAGIDEAIAYRDKLQAFMQQSMDQPMDYQQSLQQLNMLFK